MTGRSAPSALASFLLVLLALGTAVGCSDETSAAGGETRAIDSFGEVGIGGDPWGGTGAPAAGIAAGFGAGATRYFQVVCRDSVLAVCMRGLNTTQAIEVVFSP